METLITLIIILVVLAIVFWLFDRYVAPVIPSPWGRVIEAVFVLIVILFLLQRFVL